MNLQLSVTPRVLSELFSLKVPQTEHPAETHSAFLSAAWLSLPPQGAGVGPPGAHRTPAIPWPLPPTSRPPLHFRALPGVSAGPGLSSAAPSDRTKKTSGSIATLGLKKFFLALGQGSRPKLGKSRSYSVEQLQPPAPGPAAQASTPKVKRAPSLQSLRLVSSERPGKGCVGPASG